MTVDLKNFIKDDNNKKHSKKKKIQKEKLLLDEDTENKDNNIVNKTETNQIHLKKTTQEKYVSERTDKKTQNVKVDSEIDREQSHFFSYFKFNLEIDLLSILLFLIALSVRIYRLKDPQFIIFDELHYGKYISHYMKRTFFFDSHPPLGKQLIAAAAYIAGYDGDFKFDRIGSPYNSDIPLFALRFVPALCGSLIVPVLYQLIIQLGLKQWTALLTGFLILCDNALLTQSRFILMESILLFFSLFSVLCILKFCKYGSTPNSIIRLMWLGLSCISVTCALCVKFVGIYTYFLILTIFFIDFWKLLKNKQYSDFALIRYLFVTVFLLLFVPLCVYTGIFYIHLKTLTKAGPHDSVMTSAFQASLEGGLASITKGQPLLVSHGSQVTLRHTHGRTCWLHSHPHVYPVRYPDKRGSSHQQQVTCYSFKDVNNWWIVKRPHKNNLVVEDITDAIKHGDIVQLVHGITSRALNSHDVAAPISPHCQEVSCYIDYNVSMPAQNLWRVDIVNKEQTGDTWHTIQSHVRLVHVNSSQALRYTGRQLPDWGFNQHEIVTDKVIYQDDTIWNVEEHRYTKSDDQKERERQLVNAEMIPTAATKLSFWDKFKELQYKMMMTPVSSSTEQTHMYSSDPLEWLFMKRGIAYWVSSTSNAQIHLLGNIALWYSASFSLIIYSLLLMFYLLRRRRQCYDIPTEIWEEFIFVGQLFFCGYLFHFLPYFFIERILFLHHYLPAYIFKILLSVYIIEHLRYLLKYVLKLHFIADMFTAAIIVWSLYILFVFRKFIVLSYGFDDLTTSDVLNLRWQDTWDFIIHKS